MELDGALFRITDFDLEYENVVLQPLERARACEPDERRLYEDQ